MKKTPWDIIILNKYTKNHDHMLCCSWNMTHDRCNCYFSFWAIFCPFTPVTARRYHHFTQVYQKSRSYDILFLRYGKWHMQLLVFMLGYFSPVYPTPSSPSLPTAQKIKIKKNWKKYLDTSLFYTSVPKIMIICYTVPEIWHVMDAIVTFHFGLFFCPFTSVTAWKMKILEKEKNTWRYHHFAQVYQKLWSYAILFLKCGTWRM